MKIYFYSDSAMCWIEEVYFQTIDPDLAINSDCKLGYHHFLMIYTALRSIALNQQLFLLILKMRLICCSMTATSENFVKWEFRNHLQIRSSLGLRIEDGTLKSRYVLITPKEKMSKR